VNERRGDRAYTTVWDTNTDQSSPCYLHTLHSVSCHCLSITYYFIPHIMHMMGLSQPYHFRYYFDRPHSSTWSFRPKPFFRGLSSKSGNFQSCTISGREIRWHIQMISTSDGSSFNCVYLLCGRHDWNFTFRFVVILKVADPDRTHQLKRLESHINSFRCLGVL
jgi:hypothetical protein